MIEKPIAYASAIRGCQGGVVIRVSRSSGHDFDGVTRVAVNLSFIVAIKFSKSFFNE